MKTHLLFLLILVSVMGYAQDQLFKLVSYNSLRYSPNNIDARHPDLRLIMNDLQPDLLCVQELSGLASATMYMDSVLNVDSTTYSMASFIDGNDLDVSLYYKTAKFTAFPTSSSPTALRDIYHFQLSPIGIPDTLHVFGLHLKASSGSANQQRRKAEVDVLRQVTDQFGPNANFIVCGDFNIYGSNEPAYARLLQDTPNNNGHFVDQLTMTGTWNNAIYAPYHTQSPRTTQFNGGAHGGMDDRFDMILMSEALDDTVGLHYVSGSMLAYGNDGLHYNNAINAAPTNAAVGQTLADALHYASDHIPIVAEFEYTIPNNTNTIERSISQVDIFNTPNGILIHNPENKELALRAYSLDGRQVFSKTISSTTPLYLNQNGVFVMVISDHQENILVRKLVM
ncbi:MAG: hypothetical protein RLP14_10300 [Owenweeksia sp.]